MLTGLFAISVWAQSGRVGTGRYDQQIQQEVTKVLQSKDKWKGITASTDDGIVTLQGTVKLLIDKLDAGKKVDKEVRVQVSGTTSRSKETCRTSSCKGNWRTN